MTVPAQSMMILRRAAALANIQEFLITAAEQSSAAVFFLRLNKGQDIRIDHVCMSGHQAVREAGVNLERAMLEQFCL